MGASATVEMGNNLGNRIAPEWSEIKQPRRQQGMEWWLKKTDRDNKLLRKMCRRWNAAKEKTNQKIFETSECEKFQLWSPQSIVSQIFHLMKMVGDDGRLTFSTCHHMFHMLAASAMPIFGCRGVRYSLQRGALAARRRLRRLLPYDSAR